MLLDVNQEYIRSASQDDAYRTEPPFKLQGSYRNMNKLAEKVVSGDERRRAGALIDDHYASESQTLTTGAEQNLLKLAELRGRMTEQQAARWAEIKRTFARVQIAGGADDDPVTRLTGHISALADRVEGVGNTIARSFTEAASAGDAPSQGAELVPYIARLDQALTAMAEVPRGSDGEASHRAVALLAQQFGVVARRIEALGEAVARIGTEPHRGPASVASSSGDIGPYLSKLEETLSTLASSPRGGEVVQVLPAGVGEVIARMVGSIEEGLIPAVRSLEQEVRASEPATDPKMAFLLEKSLKNLDLLRDLLAALRKIDTTGLQAAAKAAPRRTKKGG